MSSAIPSPKWPRSWAARLRHAASSPPRAAAASAPPRPLQARFRRPRPRRQSTLRRCALRRLVRDFKRAWEAKDISALIGLLDPGATATADGGGLVSAHLVPIEGAAEIARFLVDLAGRAPGNLMFLERTVNGQPGLVAQQDGVTVTVFAFDIPADRITRILAVRNPGKLRPWTTG